MSRPRQGFSFIEVIISIAIMSAILILIQATIRSGVLVRTSKNQGIALSIARNELENLRIGGYASLPSSGSFSDGLLDTLPQATATLSVSTYNAKTKQITVQVMWMDSGSIASSTVSLGTLITETGGLP